MAMKICPRCKKRPRARSKNGSVQSYCNPCRRVYRREHLTDPVNKEAIHEYHEAWRRNKRLKV